MFGLLFGWRKASKCKKVIKQAQCRLNLLKKKRHAIVKHLREDTANLIKFGHQNIALVRAEQLIKDESVAVAYELIDNFFDFIRTHFNYIRRHKDCPDDINEAVSSLIYASARCGDLPELREIRKLFEERYGQKLALAAVELFPGNLVNDQIKEALNTISVSDDMKQRMVNEIATDYCLKPQILALEYYPEWQQQVVTDVRTSTDEKSEGKIVPIDLNMTSGSDLSPTVRWGFRGISVSKEESVAADSSESSTKLPEETTLVYLDDVEEIQSWRDEDSQDQRGFKFKAPPILSTRFDAASYELRSEKSRSKSDVCRKRIRRSLVYQESQGLKEIECPSYYAQPQKSRSSHQRKTRDGEREMMVAPLASNRRVYPNRVCAESIDLKGKEDRASASSCRTRKGGAAPYVRNATMPPERSKSRGKEEFQRSNSCPVQEHPNHVHPKLPDYDDLTATFMALKKEFAINKLHCSNA